MSIITTFENQCRALASASSPDENASRFLVGSLSPNCDNFLYLFEYKDDNNNLAKISFKFPYGESWHLNTSSNFPQYVTGITRRKGLLEASLFRLPTELTNPIEDDYGLSESPIEKVFDLATGDTKNLTRQCHWHPDDGDRLMICNDGNLEFWDIDQQQMSLKFSIFKALLEKMSSKVPHVTDLRWSSLFNCSVVAAAVGSKIYGIDTRIPESSPSSICWLIEDNRCNHVKSVDFNPNSQYYLASGGDDCRSKFWDLRKTSNPILHFQTHSHWIWSVRYNPFHDQLVLSAGSDARVALMKIQTIASEPFGQMIDYDDEELGLEKVSCEDEDADIEPEESTRKLSSHRTEIEPDEDNSKAGVTSNPKEDKVINLYEEHDDSVYAAEWATDPWIFASLGFESRLVINKVPKAEKFSILF